jgi:myosin heavy subunit
MQAAHDDNDMHFDDNKMSSEFIDEIKKDNQAAHQNTDDNAQLPDLLNEINEGELEQAKSIPLPYYDAYIKELKDAVIKFKENHEGQVLTKFSNDFIKEMELQFQKAKQTDDLKKVRVVLGSTLWQQIADELQKYNVVQMIFTQLGPLLRAIRAINAHYKKEKLAVEDVFERDGRLQEKSEANTKLESTVKCYKRTKQKSGPQNPDAFDYKKMKENKEKYENLYVHEKQQHEACQAREIDLKETVIALKKENKSLEEDNHFVNSALEAKGVKQIVDEAKAIAKQYAQERNDLEIHAQKQASILYKLEEKNSELEQKLSQRGQKIEDMTVRIKDMDQKAKEESKKRLELKSELEHLKTVHNKEVLEKDQKIKELTREVNALKETNEKLSSENNDYSVKKKVDAERIRSLDELVAKYEEVDKKLKLAEDELKVKEKTIDEKQFTVNALTKRLITLESHDNQKKSSASNAEAGSVGQSRSYKNPANVFDFRPSSPSTTTASSINDYGLSAGANGNTTCARDIYKPTW